MEPSLVRVKSRTLAAIDGHQGQDQPIFARTAPNARHLLDLHCFIWVACVPAHLAPLGLQPGVDLLYERHDSRPQHLTQRQ